MLRKLGIGLAGILVAACTSTPQVAVIEPTDTHLTCRGISTEAAKLQAVMDEAHHNKGFNLANVFAWPGPVYAHNFHEADNAEEWAQRRRVALTDLYIRKGCAPDITQAGTPTADLNGEARAERIMQQAMGQYR